MTVFVFVIVIDPAAFVTLMPVPAVIVLITGDPPVEPIRSWPLDGADVVVRRPATPLYRNEFDVRPLTVRDVSMITADGSDTVTAPVDADTVIWLLLPVSEVTPELATEILPAPFVTLIPDPGVMVDRV